MKRKKNNILFDFLNSINFTKENIFDKDPITSKNEYSAFIINKFLSYHIDCIIYVNEMNMRSNLPSQMQYLYLLHSIRKNKRFSKFMKKDKEPDDINIIKEYYKCSTKIAIEYKKVLTDENISILKNELFKGGC
jgi:N-formylglutamate amidohydrolase